MTEINNILDVKKYLDNIKVVIFDLDDTLYSEKEYVKSGYNSVSKLLPQVVNPMEKMWDFFEKGKSAIDELLISENIFSEELKEKCLNTYRFHSPIINFYAGVRDLLIDLRKEGYKLGIITDGRVEGQKAKISALGLEELVDKIIITDELGGIEFRKPNETSYKIMKDFLDVDYCQMIYVGDNINKDFIAPNKLGIKSMWLRNEDGLYYK